MPHIRLGRVPGSKAHDAHGVEGTIYLGDGEEGHVPDAESACIVPSLDSVLSKTDVVGVFNPIKPEAAKSNTPGG